MANQVRALACALGCGVLLSGCATVVNGTTQKIGVSSTPTGADVMVDNQQHIVTPATVPLARDQSHSFVFKKEGYQDDSFVLTSGTSGWVWGNVLLGGASLGVLSILRMVPLVSSRKTRCMSPSCRCQKRKRQRQPWFRLC